MANTPPKQPDVLSHMLGYDESRTDDDPRRQSPHLKEQKFMSCLSGAISEILLACLAATLPILLLSALLVGLIFKYQVDTRETAYPDLQSPSTDLNTGSVYYVNYSATRLMTVASWSSSVACLLTFFIMTLASYPLARQLLRATKNKTSALPTPYQLGLLLGAMNANIGSLFNWACYASWKDKFPTTRIVKLAFTAFIFSSAVSYAIIACDTWLHITTSTVPLSVIDRQADTTYLGRGIYNDSCATNDGNLFKKPCTILYAAVQQWLIGAPEAFRILSNVSTKSFVGAFEHGGKTYAYLADANIPKQREFSATAFALSTTCTSVSESCKRSASGQTTPFNCSSAFYGDLMTRNVSGLSYSSYAGVQLFNDTKFSRRIADTEYVQTNPFYMGTWALVPLTELVDENPLLNDSGIIQAAQGYFGYVLNCAVTVYDLQYAWINGSFSHVQSLTQSNATMASIVAAPWFLEQYSSFSLTNTAYIAGLQNTSTALASVWADRFSVNAIGLSAGVMSSRQTLQEQQRHDMLVARVMKAPLWCMITLNLVFVVMAIVLTITALVTLREQNVHEVQARLSTIGLVGALFENENSERPVKSPEDWFSERSGRIVKRQKRVGVSATPSGGFGFVVAEA